MIDLAVAGQREAIEQSSGSYGGGVVPKLEVSEVSHGFVLSGPRGKTQWLQVLDKVSLTASEGSTVVLLGSSGCGKTTLLRTIMGLEHPSEGTVTVDGVEARGCGRDRAMVFQQAELLPWRSAASNVELGLEALGMPKAERRACAREHLERVGLADAADRRPHQLSGGMKQRVGIARALAVDPAVLLMDEPFGAVDAQTRESLQGSLLEIQKRTGKTIVFVTHDLDEAVLLADQVVVMAARPGRVSAIVDVTLPARQAAAEMSDIKESKEYLKTRSEVRDAMEVAGGGHGAGDSEGDSEWPPVEDTA